MRIIIVGCGKVGSTLAEQLCGEGHELTVIDRSEELVQSITARLSVRGIVGSGTSISVQKEARVRRAKLLIAATEQDEVNLVCCLIAKKLGNCHTIARVRNPIYLRELDDIREELGLSMIINPELACAQEISRMLRFPAALETTTLAKGRVELVKIQIPEHSIGEGLAVHYLALQTRTHALVCIVERPNCEPVIPNGTFVLKNEDVITCTVSPYEANRFFRAIGAPNTTVRSVLLIGCGISGFFLARQLLEAGMHVKSLNATICAVKNLRMSCPMPLSLKATAPTVPYS